MKEKILPQEEQDTDPRVLVGLPHWRGQSSTGTLPRKDLNVGEWTENASAGAMFQSLPGVDKDKNP